MKSVKFYKQFVQDTFAEKWQMQSGQINKNMDIYFILDETNLLGFAIFAN